MDDRFPTRKAPAYAKTNPSIYDDRSKQPVTSAQPSSSSGKKQKLKQTSPYLFDDEKGLESNYKNIILVSFKDYCRFVCVERNGNRGLAKLKTIMAPHHGVVDTRHAPEIFLAFLETCHYVSLKDCTSPKDKDGSYQLVRKYLFGEGSQREGQLIWHSEWGCTKNVFEVYQSEIVHLKLELRRLSITPANTQLIEYPDVDDLNYNELTEDQCYLSEKEMGYARSRLQLDDFGLRLRAYRDRPDEISIKKKYDGYFLVEFNEYFSAHTPNTTPNTYTPDFNPAGVGIYHLNTVRQELQHSFENGRNDFGVNIIKRPHEHDVRDILQGLTERDKQCLREIGCSADLLDLHDAMIARREYLQSRKPNDFPF